MISKSQPPRRCYVYITLPGETKPVTAGRYELVDLTQALLTAIDKDDDILTQFHESEELKRRLRDARSFDEVAEVLKFAATETDDA